MRRLVRRCLAAIGWKRIDADGELSREIASHVALLEDEHRRRGLPEDEAHLAARRAIGSVALAKDLHRDARSFAWIDDLRRDLRHTLRTFRRSPGFALVAILALGLGIGVNTTFFTIVDAICLRGLPIESPDRVLYVSSRDARERPGGLSYEEFDDLRGRATTFSQVAAYVFTVAAVGDDRQPPARVPGAFISAGGIELLGDRPVLGRTFRPDEDQPGRRPVVIIGSELWSSRYAADPGIVGQTITVNGIPSTVIGVMPRGFMFPANADLWRPMADLPAAVRGARSERRLAVYARLRDGASDDQARAELAVVGSAWARDFAASNRDVSLRAVPINEQLNPDVTQPAWLAFITVGVLALLVACANVANLLLMRGAGRGREMAIRTSIGATRARVVRQLLVESAVVAAVAAAAGVFLASIGVQVLAAIVPPEALPYWMAFTIDRRVLAATLAVSLGCVFACGLPAALHVSKLDVQAVLAGSGTTTMTRPARRWIAGLLAAEFAVTLLLITLAVTAIRANIEGRRTEFQLDAQSLVTMWVTLPGDSYGTPAERSRFLARLQEAVLDSGSPTEVTLASALPYGGGLQQPVTIPGSVDEAQAQTVSVVAIDERYFAVLGIPLLRGRAFSDRDGQPGYDAAIVNQGFVQRFLGETDPLGARIRLGGADAPLLQVVGVATTVRQQPLGTQPEPVAFVPLRASPPQTAAIVVRTSDSAASVAQLRREVARLDANLPLYRVMPLEQALHNAGWNGRLADVMVRSIAVVAFVLALVGLYAVTGHSVERWTREIGLRMALGAGSRQIRWLVVRRMLGLLGTGLAGGILCALAFDRVFNEPSPGDGGVQMMAPGPLLAIVASLAAVAMLACLGPIRRAARVEPLVALRTE